MHPHWSLARRHKLTIFSHRRVAEDNPNPHTLLMTTIELRWNFPKRIKWSSSGGGKKSVLRKNDVTVKYLPAPLTVWSRLPGTTKKADKRYGSIEKKKKKDQPLFFLPPYTYFYIYPIPFPVHPPLPALIHFLLHLLSLPAFFYIINIFFLPVPFSFLYLRLLSLQHVLSVHLLTILSLYTFCYQPYLLPSPVILCSSKPPSIQLNCIPLPCRMTGCPSWCTATQAATKGRDSTPSTTWRRPSRQWKGRRRWFVGTRSKPSRSRCRTPVPPDSHFHQAASR